MPGHAGADVHPHLGLVVVPAPGGEQPRLEREVRLLADELVEHRAIDRLDGRVHRRGTGGRVERRQVDVVGDGERVARRGRGEAALGDHGRQERAGSCRERLATVQCQHRSLPRSPWRSPQRGFWPGCPDPNISNIKLCPRLCKALLAGAPRRFLCTCTETFGPGGAAPQHGAAPVRAAARSGAPEVGSHGLHPSRPVGRTPV